MGQERKDTNLVKKRRPREHVARGVRRVPSVEVSDPRFVPQQIVGLCGGED